MRRIIAWSLQLRLLLAASAAVLLFFGVTELRRAPVDVVPEFSRPYVEVQTEALGLSADEVEAMITVPLEADMLNGVSWVEEIRSESIPGLSSIVLVFEPGTDLMVARQMVQERLVGVHALPNVSKPPAMLQPLSSTSRFLKVGLTSETHSLIELSVLARWTIVPRLMGVPGVAQASIWGQRKRQLQVQVDPTRLQRAGLTLHQIIETAGNALWVSPLSFLNASSPGTGGWIETPNQRLGIQHQQPISTPEELAQVTIEGTVTRLGDVATVVEEHQPLIGNAVVDDEPALMLVIEKFPWANTSEVTQGVEEALAALELGLPGVELDSTLFRPANYLEEAIANLSTAFAIGLVLMLAALLALAGSWRSALVTALAVVLSSLAAGTVLYLSGAPLNLLLLTGLIVALTALIDDGVVDGHNIARRLRERRPAGGPAEAVSVARIVLDAAAELRAPLLYGTLIALVAVVPVLLVGSVLGIFAQEAVLPYALALLTSLLVSLTITPALSLLIVGSGAPSGEPPALAAALERGFDAVLSRAPRPAGGALLGGVVAVAVVLVAVFAAGPVSESSLLPEFRERDVLVELDGAPGTSELAMRRIARRASQELRALEAVRSVSAHVGRAVMSDRVANVNSAELWVVIDPEADYEASVASIREVMTGYPGFDVDVATYLSERIADEAALDDEFAVRLYGDDLNLLRRKAEEVRSVLAGIAGIEDPRVEYLEEHPALEIEVDLERSKAHGVKPGDVRRAATTLLSGIEVGSLFEEQKVFDVVVWGTPEIRKSISDVEALLIDTPTGHQVRLGDVAELRIASAPNVIQRESVSRHLDVVATLAGRDPVELANEVEARVQRDVEFPLEYRAEVLGGYVARRAERERFAAGVLAAAVVALLLLQAALRSWSLAFFFLASVPLALAGGVLAGLLFGGFASLGSLLGLVAVFVLFTRQGLSLLCHYQRLEGGEAGSLTPGLVQQGTRERFPAIIATALVTALTFLPFAVMGGIAGLEVAHAMSIAVLGGLVSATLVTLLVTPALYLRFGASAEPEIDFEEEPTRLSA